jgi:hypothetical protein
MGRADDNDVMRRRNSLYEIDDPRNRWIDTNPDRPQGRRAPGEDRLRRFDNRTFCADAELVATYYDESPRDEARIVEFVAERFWREGHRVTSIAVRFTTELGATDPADDGFLLWFPLARLTVLERTGNHYRVALDKRLYDRWEVEGLIPFTFDERAH